jgi:putative transposon-encoded protein
MLSYHISTKRIMMKKIQLNVKEDIYQEFKKLCESKGTSAAVEIRRFMLSEVEKKREKGNK